MMLNHNSMDGHDPNAPEADFQCALCGADYAVTSSEREFRNEHRLGLPKLCPECRSKQRAGRNAEIIALYEKASSADGVAMATPVPRNGSRGTARGQMYTTVCDACGSETRVPFVPRGDRPVYCRDCFNARRGR